MNGFEMRTGEQTIVPETGKYKICYCNPKIQYPQKKGILRNAWMCPGNWTVRPKGSMLENGNYGLIGYEEYDALIIGIIDNTKEKIRSEILIHSSGKQTPWHVIMIAIITCIVLVVICVSVLYCLCVKTSAKPNDVAYNNQETKVAANTV